MSHPTEPTPPPSSPAWRTSALLGIAVAVVALCLRLPALHESLWVDELHTAWVVADGMEPIPVRATMGNQSPLYFYGVWLCTQIFGTHEWSLRLPSLIGGLLAAGLLTAAAHRWTRDGWTALGIGVVAAIDGDWIFYATEARAYSLVLVLGLGQLLLACRLLREDRFALWAALVFLSLTQLYLHYSTLLFTGAVGILLLAFLPDRARRQRALVVAFTFLLGAVPSLWHLGAIFERRGNWAQLFGAWSIGEWTRWGTIALLLVPALAAWAFHRVRRQDAQTERPEVPPRWPFLAAVAVLTIGGAWLSTATGLAALFAGRYLIAAEAALLLLLAALVARLPSVGYRRAAVLAAVLLAGWFRAPQRVDHLRAENWQTVTRAIAQEFAQDTSPPAVAIAAGLIETDLLRDPEHVSPIWEAYARLPIESLYRLPEEMAPQVSLAYTRPGQLTARQRRQLAGEAVIVLLVRGYSATADQVAADVTTSLGGQWRVDVPPTQGGLVQWRVLRRGET